MPRAAHFSGAPACCYRAPPWRYSPGATSSPPRPAAALLPTRRSSIPRSPLSSAIAAYQVGAESGLLQKPVLELAVQFQGHHKEHADVLAKTVRQLGGNPVAAKSKYSFPVEGLKNQADVLRFAARLEQGAVSAYLGAVPLFANRDLSKAAASILGDEAMHWAVLRNALGENPVPSAFVA
jgi:hypothetical protein